MYRNKPIKKPKLTPEHQLFRQKYRRSRMNPHALYDRIYFGEDENIAIVIDDHTEYGSLCGCVDIKNFCYILPMEYEWIKDYGYFLLAKDADDIYIYNKQGQLVEECVDCIKKTSNRLLRKLYLDSGDNFKLIIKRRHISKQLFSHIKIMDDGLALLKNADGRIGIIRYSKLKLEFKYVAITEPTNKYMLAIEEFTENEQKRYRCELLYVATKNGITIHHTNIYLFENLTEKETRSFFNQVSWNMDRAFINGLGYMSISLQLQDFQWYLGEDDEDELENEFEDEDSDDSYYNPWSEYTIADSLYDACGGEPEALCNLDIW